MSRNKTPPLESGGVFNKAELLVIDAVHVLDQLQNLVGVADLVVWAHPR